MVIKYLDAHPLGGRLLGSESASCFPGMLLQAFEVPKIARQPSWGALNRDRAFNARSYTQLIPQPLDLRPLPI
jgi:hypothetical protein